MSNGKTSSRFFHYISLKRTEDLRQRDERDEAVTKIIRMCKIRSQQLAVRQLMGTKLCNDLLLLLLGRRWPRQGKQTQCLPLSVSVHQPTNRRQRQCLSSFVRSRKNRWRNWQNVFTWCAHFANELLKTRRCQRYRAQTGADFGLWR